MNRPTCLRQSIFVLLIGGLAAFILLPQAAADQPSDDVILLAQADDAMNDEPAERDRPGMDRDRMEKLREWRERRAAEGRSEDRQRPGRPPRELTAEQREQALAVLRDVNPHVAERMEAALKSDDSKRAERALARMSGRLLEMHEMKQRDPEAYKLRVADNRAKIETIRLAGQLRRAEAEGKADEAAALETQLREHLEKHFEIRQRLREKELQLLEQRIERMREELKEHRAKKQELIDQSMTRIRQGRPDRDRGHGERPHRPHPPRDDEPDDQLDLD